MILFAIWRIYQRAPMDTEDKTDFVPVIATGRYSTPESVALDPRSEPEEFEADDVSPLDKTDD